MLYSFFVFFCFFFTFFYFKKKTYFVPVGVITKQWLQKIFCGIFVFLTERNLNKFFWPLSKTRITSLEKKKLPFSYDRHNILLKIMTSKNASYVITYQVAKMLFRELNSRIMRVILDGRHFGEFRWIKLNIVWVHFGCILVDSGQNYVNPPWILVNSAHCRQGRDRFQFTKSLFEISPRLNPNSSPPLTHDP